MRHRVAFFCPVPHFKGGAERSLFDLMSNPSVEPLLLVPAHGPVSEAAAARGIECEVVELGRVSSIRRPVRPGAALAAGGDWWRAAARLRDLAAARRIDVVHSNGLKAHCVAGLAHRLGGAPCVFHIRDIAVRPSERLIWRGLASLSSHTILVSRACWGDAALAPNVSVVFNGIESGSRPRPTRARRAGDPLVVGICGRIHPFKGHEVALSWVREAVDSGLEVHLSIRGEADPADLDYQRMLERRVGELGIGDRVSFEGQREGLDAVYGGLDVVLVPSTTPDPLPRSVMEALSLGLPVVGYPAGGIPEMIEHGHNGWLARDGQAFVSALRVIAQAGEPLARVQQAALASVHERFSLPRMHDRISAVYRSVRAG